MGLYNWYSLTKKKKLDLQSEALREALKEEDLQETPNLKTPNPQVVSEQPDGILWTLTDPANGEAYLIAVGTSESWDATLEYKKRVIMVPTRVSSITSKATFIESAMHVTIDGTPLTIRFMTGPRPKSFLTRLVRKRKRRKS